MYRPIAVKARRTEVRPNLLRAILVDNADEEAVAFCQGKFSEQRRGQSREFVKGRGEISRNDDCRRYFDHLVPNSPGQRSAGANRSACVHLYLTTPCQTIADDFTVESRPRSIATSRSWEEYELRERADALTRKL